MNDEKGSLKRRFSDMIIKRILSGQLSPGDRLPTERALAQEYKLSRGSVNQGILDLERMGFVRVVPRHGNYVAEYLRDTTPEITLAIMNYDSALIDRELFRDLMSFRILIECECAYLAARNISNAAIGDLNRLTNRIFSAGEGVADALFDYHYYIVGLSGNKAYLMLFKSFERMIRKLIEAHYISTPGELDKVLPLYNDLTRALSGGDCVNARRTMNEILRYAADYLMSAGK